MKVQRNTQCPACGATNVGIMDLCLICGAELPMSEDEVVASTPVGVEQDGSTCTKCGAELKSGNRFCTKCGTPVGA